MRAFLVCLSLLACSAHVAAALTSTEELPGAPQCRIEWRSAPTPPRDASPEAKLALEAMAAAHRQVGRPQVPLDCALGRYRLVLTYDIDHDTDGPSLALVADGEIAWRESCRSWNFELYGEHLLGAGQPALVVSCTSGVGRPLLFELSVLRLEPQPAVIFTDAAPGFHAVAHRETGRLVISRANYAWLAGYRFLDAGTVFFTVDHGAIRVAPELMRAAGPGHCPAGERLLTETADQSCRRTVEIEAEDDHDPKSFDLDVEADRAAFARRLHRFIMAGEPPPRELLEAVLQLIATGHAATAYTLFDAAWPAQAAGHREVLAAILLNAARDAESEGLSALNGGALFQPLAALLRKAEQQTGAAAFRFPAFDRDGYWSDERPWVPDTRSPLENVWSAARIAGTAEAPTVALVHCGAARRQFNRFVIGPDGTVTRDAAAPYVPGEPMACPRQ